MSETKVCLQHVNNLQNSKKKDYLVQKHLLEDHNQWEKVVIL